MARDSAQNKEKPDFSLKPNFVPQLSSASPEWGKQVSEDLIRNANLKGSPGFDPGPDQARQVEQMVALGASPTDIAAILRIEEKLLKHYYAYELDTGANRINNEVAKVALGMALSGAVPDMTKFWLKTRAGWKETKAVELTGANGGPVEFAEVKRKMLDAIEAEFTEVPNDSGK